MFRKKNFVVVLLSALTSLSYAGGGSDPAVSYPAAKPQGDQFRSDELGTLEIFSAEVRHLIFEKMEPSDLENMAFASRACSADAVSVNQRRWIRKVARIEAIMAKYGKWIDLLDYQGVPTGKQIASFPIVQELGVELLGNNPSKFQEQKYCPDSYKKVVINEKVISMCWDFPMDRVIGVSQGKRDSDPEILASLNQAYQGAGLPSRFDSATREEWNYADTAGGREFKKKADASLPLEDPRYLGHFAPYHGISMGPSGEAQPRSIFQNAVNSIGFRRAGQQEWAKETTLSHRFLMSGSWFSNPRQLVSGSAVKYLPELRERFIGPSRLVRTN